MNDNDILSIQQSYGIIGRSPLLLQALNAALQAAPYDVNVLVTGENGVGKEVFHKILHQYSPRRHGRCVAVNCGGLPEGTIDSELFGHVKGAFTGALNDRKGYFEEADGGTIFLDEVGELPLPTQARLLRILETGEYYRVGSSETRKTDVRVVAATNVDLQKAIRRGTFREDLFYRLSTITIRVPSLRERPEDIYQLFRRFAGTVASRYKMPPIQLDDAARRKLQAYQWPGNVRQLLHVVEEISIVEADRTVTAEVLMRHLPAFDERIVVSDETTDGSETFQTGEKQMLYRMLFELKNQLEEVRAHVGMASAHPAATPAPPRALPPTVVTLPTDFAEAVEVEEVPRAAETTEMVAPGDGTTTLRMPQPGQPAAAPGSPTAPASRTLADIEREAIVQALQRNRGNKRRAAEELGISERTIHRKIQEYEL